MKPMGEKTPNSTGLEAFTLQENWKLSATWRDSVKFEKVLSNFKKYGHALIGQLKPDVKKFPRLFS